MDKIIGLGNALVDVLATLHTDNILGLLQLPKGSMTLIDEEKYTQIGEYMKDINAKRATGGSAGNVIRALAHLGGACGFIGKINNDEPGNFFRESMMNKGVDAKLLLSDEHSTGVASTFISPDGERTFATYLGAASTMKADDLQLDMFKGYTYLFIEGYLVQDHEMILHAIELAAEAGLQICLDLASYNIVNEDKEFFTMLLKKYVDIVFANEEEAKAFTGKNVPEDMLKDLSQICSIAVVKVGAKGSYIRKGSDTVFVPAIKINDVVDTTGAGDYFAGGFLFGLLQGNCLEKCAKIGTLLSAHVIQHVGAELSEDEWNHIRARIASDL